MFNKRGSQLELNPEFAIAIYYGLQILAATLVSQFFSSPYLLICLRQKIAPTTRFATTPTAKSGSN
jgi:hypothetical protein